MATFYFHFIFIFSNLFVKLFFIFGSAQHAANLIRKIGQSVEARYKDRHEYARNSSVFHPCNNICRITYHPVCASNGVVYKNECEYYKARCYNNGLTVNNTGYSCKMIFDNINKRNNNMSSSFNDLTSSNSLLSSALPLSIISDSLPSSHLISPPLASSPPLVSSSSLVSSPLSVSSPPSIPHSPLPVITSFYPSYRLPPISSPTLSGTNLSTSLPLYANDSYNQNQQKSQSYKMIESPNHILNAASYSKNGIFGLDQKMMMPPNYLSPNLVSSSSASSTSVPFPLPVLADSESLPLLSSLHPANAMPNFSELSSYYLRGKNSNKSKCTFACQTSLSPVCGSDGVTYGSKCLLEKEACILNGGEKGSLYLRYDGVCKQLDEQTMEDLKKIQSSAMDFHKQNVKLDGETIGESMVNKIKFLLKQQNYPKHHSLLVKEEESMHPTPTLAKSKSYTSPEVLITNAKILPSQMHNVTQSEYSAATQPSSNLLINDYKNNSDVAEIGSISETMKYIHVNTSSPASTKSCYTICPLTGPTVCGSNGITYTNMCELQTYGCLLEKNISAIHTGSCESPVSSNIDFLDLKHYNLLNKGVGMNLNSNSSSFHSTSKSNKNYDNKHNTFSPSFSNLSPSSASNLSPSAYNSSFSVSNISLSSVSNPHISPSNVSSSVSNPPVSTSYSSLSAINLLDTASAFNTSNFSFPLSSSSYFPLKDLNMEKPAPSHITTSLMHQQFQMGNSGLGSLDPKFYVPLKHNTKLSNLGNSFNNVFTVSELKEKHKELLEKYSREDRKDEETAEKTEEKKQLKMEQNEWFIN